jgi:hypothetical protein
MKQVGLIAVFPKDTSEELSCQLMTTTVRLQL